MIVSVNTSPVFEVNAAFPLTVNPEVVFPPNTKYVLPVNPLMSVNGLADIVVPFCTRFDATIVLGLPNVTP